MTPFGIRKKLKSLLGLGTPEAEVDPRPTYDVAIVAPNGDEYTVRGREGETLVTVSGRGAWPIMTGCAEGDCGTCRVEVLEGAASISAEEDRERRTREEHQVPDGWRLGCQARLQGPGVKLHIIDPFAEQDGAAS